jgi:hypothetical protein
MSSDVSAGGGGGGGGLLSAGSTGMALADPLGLPGGNPGSGSVLANDGGLLSAGRPPRGGLLGAGKLLGAAASAGASEACRGGGLLSEGGGGGGRLERPPKSAGAGRGTMLGGGTGADDGGGGGIAPLREGGGAEVRLGGGKPAALRPAAASGLASPSRVFCRGADEGTPGPTLGRDFFAKPSNTSRSDPPLSLMLGLLSPSQPGCARFDSAATLAGYFREQDLQQ